MKVLVAVALLVLCTQATASLNACSDSEIDQSFHQMSSSKWSELHDEVEFQRFRIQHLAAAIPAYTGTASSKGVAVVVNDRLDVASAYAAVSQLRTLSALPIEVFHAGAIRAEEAAAFESVGNVQVMSLHNLEQTSLIAAGVLHSSHGEVVVMDARTLPLADPASLFENAEYKTKGLMMFSALHKTAAANPVWSVLGVACIDAVEQSSVAAVVNKAKAWNAVNVATGLRSQFYQSLTNGEQNVMRLAALATNTEFHMNGAPRLTGANYNVEGVNQYCAHLTVHSVNGVDMFSHSANSEVNAAGTAVSAIKCAAGVQSGSDDSLVATHVRVQSAVPDVISRIRLQACTAGTKSQAEAEALAATTFLPYKIDLSNYVVGVSQYVTIPWNVLVPQCAYLFYCLSSSYGQDTINVAFVNITTGPVRSANVDIATPSSRNIIRGQGFGNSTYIYVNNHEGTRRGCSVPIIGLADSDVNYNIAMGSSAIIAVAFDYQRTYFNAPITLGITYNGDSSGVSSSAVASPAILLAVAAIAAIAQRFF